MKVNPVSNIIPMNNRKKRKPTKDDFIRIYDPNKPPDNIA